MAKLEGVKTLDMVNGKITKVEYNGSVYSKVKEKAKTGDLVLSNGVHDADAGNFYEVNTKDKFGDAAIIDDVQAERSNFIGFDVFRKSMVVEEVKTTPTFKVGDFAKVIRSYRGLEGEIVEIIENDEPWRANPGNIVIRMVVSGIKMQAEPDQLIKATDKEVKQAKRDAKFVKIGRKPSEFKKGDIIRIATYQNGHVEGSVVEVVRVENSELKVKGDSKIGLTEYFASADCVELIAPVESRIDAEVTK